MYVIAGATGKTGSIVAKTLLERGQKVRVVVRDDKKAGEWRARGAEVVSALTADALRGAEGLYLMVPPDYAAPDMLAAQRQMIDRYAEVLKSARPKFVLVLSSVGAQHEAGTGPVRTLNYAERKLEPDAALRAAYFVENWGSVLGVAREQGILPSSLTIDQPASMVDTADIGRVAAEILIEKKKGITELAGPVDVKPTEVAAAIGKILGREVKAIQIPEEGIVPALKQAGLSDHLAELFREMTVALNNGHMTWTQKPLRGKISLEESLRKLLQ